ncbi:hypothetical protein GCM10009628_27500 [Paeniglutamicibacter kerguelensis]
MEHLDPSHKVFTRFSESGSREVGAENGKSPARSPRPHEAGKDMRTGLVPELCAQWPESNRP